MALLLDNVAREYLSEEVTFELKDVQQRINSAGQECPNPAHAKERFGPVPGRYSLSPWNILLIKSVSVCMRPWATLLTTGSVVGILGHTVSV